MLDLVFNHLALPPQLPGRADDKIEEIEQALIARLLGAGRMLRDSTDFFDQWDCIRRSLQTCKTLNLGGKLNRKSLISEFQALDSRDVLILHVSQQNAGILISRGFA